jgi:lipoprotein signal peptidase
MKACGQSFKQKSYLGSFVFLFLIALDQLSKNFAINIYRNYNFAFSLPLPLWLMYLVYILVIGIIIYYLFTHKVPFSCLTILGWILILSGAFCNIAERIILGYVRDFVYISLFGLTGIYNLADGYIILGILVLLFSNIETKNLNQL